MLIWEVAAFSFPGHFTYVLLSWERLLSKVSGGGQHVLGLHTLSVEVYRPSEDEGRLEGFWAVRVFVIPDLY